VVGVVAHALPRDLSDHVATKDARRSGVRPSWSPYSSTLTLPSVPSAEEPPSESAPRPALKSWSLSLPSCPGSQTGLHGVTVFVAGSACLRPRPDATRTERVVGGLDDLLPIAKVSEAVALCLDAHLLPLTGIRRGDDRLVIEIATEIGPACLTAQGLPTAEHDVDWPFREWAPAPLL
jgi:hypothetical protein